MKEYRFRVKEDDELTKVLDGIGDLDEVIPQFLKLVFSKKPVINYLAKERVRLVTEIGELRNRLQQGEANPVLYRDLIGLVRDQSKSIESIALKALEVQQNIPPAVDVPKTYIPQGVAGGLASVKEVPKTEKATVPVAEDDDDDFFSSEDEDTEESESGEGELFNGSDMASIIALNKKMSGGE